MKIDKSVIEKYAIQCPISTSKCDSIRDIEDKILRAIHTGKKIEIMDDIVLVNYYHNCFVIEGNRVVDMYKDSKNYWYVNEDVKQAYDRKYLKIVV